MVGEGQQILCLNLLCNPVHGEDYYTLWRVVRQELPTAAARGQQFRAVFAAYGGDCFQNPLAIGDGGADGHLFCACAVNGVHIHAGLNCAAAAPHGRAYGVMEVFAVIVPANRRTGGLNQGAVSLFQRLHCPAPLSGLGNKKALPPN